MRRYGRMPLLRFSGHLPPMTQTEAGVRASLRSHPPSNRGRQGPECRIYGKRRLNRRKSDHRNRSVGVVRMELGMMIGGPSTRSGAYAGPFDRRSRDCSGPTEQRSDRVYTATESNKRGGFRISRRYRAHRFCGRLPARRASLRRSASRGAQPFRPPLRAGKRRAPVCFARRRRL